MRVTLSTNSDRVQPRKLPWRAPNCLEDGTEESSCFCSPGKNFRWMTGHPFHIIEASKPEPPLSPLSSVWQMKDGCDASKRNPQAADPLKLTFVNTSKTSLNIWYSVQGIHSARSPGGRKLLPKDFLLPECSPETETYVPPLSLFLPCFDFESISQ